MKRFLLLILWLTSTAFAQKLPDAGFTQIRIADADRMLHFEIKPVNSEPETYMDRQYYWYGANKVHETQGGFSGKLLNGFYCEYYLNKNLKEKGTFKKGLKDGVWKSWTPEGVLTASTTWKNGVKSGAFYVYDEKGEVKQKGTYADNLLHGDITFYSSPDSLIVRRYRKGKEQPAKAKSSLWKKLHLSSNKSDSAQKAPVTITPAKKKN